MNIATKKRLNEAMKKPWEYMAKEYTFQSWDELNGKVIIATDLDSITVDLDDLDMFLAGLIEVGAKKNGHNGHAVESAVEAYQPIRLNTMNEETQTSIIGGLRSVFDELSQAQSPEKIKSLSLKASNMVKITQAVSGLARLELDLHKAAQVKKSNKS